MTCNYSESDPSDIVGVDSGNSVRSSVLISCVSSVGLVLGRVERSIGSLELPSASVDSHGVVQLDLRVLEVLGGPLTGSLVDEVVGVLELLLPAGGVVDSVILGGVSVSGRTSLGGESLSIGSRVENGASLLLQKLLSQTST